MADSKSTCTIIGPTIAIRGKLRADEDLVIRGRIDAAIASSRLVHVDTDGVVKADVEAESLIVSGIVVGNITTTSRAELTATARVVGDISSPLLIIHDGARLRGKIDMPGVDRAMEAEYVAPVQVKAPAPSPSPSPGAAVPLAASPGKSAPVASPVATAGQASRPISVRSMPLKAASAAGSGATAAPLPGVKPAAPAALPVDPDLYPPVDMEIEEVEITETPELLAVYDVDVDGDEAGGTDVGQDPQTVVVPSPSDRRSGKPAPRAAAGSRPHLK